MAVVNWTTASELNNDYFTIQRSDDGVNFHDVGTVAGLGTTSQAHSYSFTDLTPMTALTYYRLRQTDYNGVSHTFEISALQPCESSGDQVNAFASGNSIDVVMNLAQSGDYVVNVLDARGRLVASRQVSAAEGYNRFEMRDVIPAVGVYFIQVTGTSKTYSQKVYITND
jgi:hypothetical protein